MADNLTPEQRKYAMSRVKQRDTDLEKIVRSELHRQGYRFRKNVKYLPGKPDVVFSKAKVAVFIDGDFWHGYKLPLWESKLSDFWKIKIKKNRKRDQKNFRTLRRNGWRVIRIWQHEIKHDLNACILKIITAVESSQRE
jgi:DNA mismatch endonuclease (patch repair protein)